MAWGLGTTLHQHHGVLQYTENRMPHQQSSRRLQPHHPQVKANHSPAIVSLPVLQTHVILILARACLQRDDHNNEDDVAVRLHTENPIPNEQSHAGTIVPVASVSPAAMTPPAADADVATAGIPVATAAPRTRAASATTAAAANAGAVAPPAAPTAGSVAQTPTLPIVCVNGALAILVQVLSDPLPA